jgi:predicted enzyme related to lactoylglutathione lyase
MPPVDRHSPGSFCWFELATRDQDAAKAFYGRLFGWTYWDNPLPHGVYTIFQLDGLDVGACWSLAAMGPDKAHIPPHWMPFIASEDASATCEKALAAGGKVEMGAFDVMEHGRMAVLADPSGAFFSVWQAKEHKGTAIHRQPGTPCWLELSSPAPELAKPFYRDVFGWKFVDGSAGGEYPHIVNDDHMIGGVAPVSERVAAAPPYWLVYFETADCDATAATAKEMGATILAGPFSMPNVGRIAVLADPQGAVLALFQGE